MTNEKVLKKKNVETATVKIQNENLTEFSKYWLERPLERPPTLERLLHPRHHCQHAGV